MANLKAQLRTLFIQQTSSGYFSFIGVENTMAGAQKSSENMHFQCKENLGNELFLSAQTHEKLVSRRTTLALSNY